MAHLKHLHSAWDVDRHIVLDSADKLVVIRFSGYENPPDSAVFAHLTSSRHDGAVGGSHSSEREHAEGGGTSPRRKAARTEADGGGGGGVKGDAEVEYVAGMEHYLATQKMDALLTALAPKVRKYCTIYAVDTNEVPHFNQLYELGHDRDPFAVMFFYRNTHIRVDVGTGNNNKVNFFAFEDVEDFLPIVDAAFRAGKLGKHMASSDKKFTTVALRR